ncbi:MAG: hypothetical protein JSR77_10370 [Planctomycetes bacterium]|nr:hypothetical protein [Planctomycetota bacterium]
MNTRHFIGAISLLAASTAYGQDFSIPWYTIDGGGGTSSGGDFTLSGTIGQHDAGGPMTGGDFSVTGGFWVGAGTGGGCNPCPADYNLDGGVDGVDVQAFFADWEQGTGCADANLDGGIDGTDVQVFFAAWENGGC